MRPLSLLRQLAITLGFFVGWLIVLDLIIRALYPEKPYLPVDTQATNSTLVEAAPNILLYEIDRLAEPAARRMIVLGSSNAMLTLRASDLRAHFPGWDIHNMAIPTSNMQQVLQVIDMVIAVSDRETLAHTVFVLGNHYGLYAPTRSLWGGTQSPLTKEMLRYGLYWQKGDEDPRPVLGYGLAGVTKEVYRVLLGVDKLSKAATTVGKRISQGKGIGWSVLDATYRQPAGYGYEKTQADTRRKNSHNKKRARQIGTRDSIPDDMFEKLQEIVTRIGEVNARLVIVEFPVPTWNRLEHFKFYRAQKRSFVESMAQQSHVDYMDLHELVPDELMGDATHPMRAGAHLFERKFAELAKALAKPLE